MVAALGSFWFFGEMMQFFLTFLLAFAVTLGLLWKTQFVSERVDVNAAIAFAIAMMFALSGAVPFIVKLLPYVAVMILVLVLVLMLGKFMGTDIESILKSKYVSIGILLFFVAVIAILGIQEYSKALFSTNATNVTNVTAPNSTGNPFVDVKNFYDYRCVAQNAFAAPMSGSVLVCIMLHPRVLGALIILAITAAVAWFVIAEKR
jgi:hypothetical protein